MIMNFGKLLGAGKTFFSGGSTAEYRLNRRVCLPKFNEGKNPFTPKPAETAPAAAPEAKKVSAPVAARPQKIYPAAAPKQIRAGRTTKPNPLPAPQPLG